MLKIVWLFCCAFYLSPMLVGAPQNIEQIRSLLPAFEQQIKEGMKETHVPGVVVAIILDNQVVYMKGFGVRKVGENVLVDPQTVFQVASVSKPITTTVIAALVAEQVVEWDSCVNTLDPSFQLQDPWITSQVTLKDFLSHRGGLPDHAGDLLEDVGFDQSSILYKLRFAPLTQFRAQYAYTNFGFTEAALAAAKAAHLSWDELVYQKLIAPLGLTSTSTRYADFIKRANRADLHVIRGNVAKSLYKRNPDAQSPAGGISTNMQDFTKWMTLQIAEGEYQGTQMISQEAVKQTHLPAITRGENQFYGLGWNVSYNHRGNPVVSHLGLFDLGTEASVHLIPNEKFGIAVFVNASRTGLAEAIISIFKDLRETGRVEKQWVSIWRERFHMVFSDPVDSFSAPLNASPPLPFRAYTGNYANDYFGEITIFDKEGKLYLAVGPKPEKFLLTSLNRDTFSFETQGENSSGLTQLIFTVDGAGVASQLSIEAFNKNGLGVFQKIP